MTGSRSFPFKVILTFAVVTSLLSLPGLANNGLHVPTIPLAWANPAPCVTHGVSGSCSEAWYPAGSAMDTLQVSILGSNTEFVCIQSASPCIDLTDIPIGPCSPCPLITEPNFYVTSPVSQHFYSEIQFDLANNFWGVNFQFGNNESGVQIRQGIAHLIDKSAFTANDVNIAGASAPLDNPVPSDNGGLLSPNPCAWDSSFVETGSNCAVGRSGGTSYHLAAATGVNYLWQPALGSADFCAAAQHFINAGVASGKDSTTCVLTGISAAVTTHTVNIFVRSDSPPRLDLGRSLAQEICALFGQGFVNGCFPYLTETEAPITGFPGFFPCTLSTICNFGAFGIYTGAYDDVFPFDASLYFTYNSRFVPGSPGIEPPNGPCSGQALPSSSPANYMFLCNPSYDSLSSQMEFAPYLTLPGCDPVVGSTINNNTRVACPANPPSAIGAGVMAEDQFGKGAYTIPIYTSTARFAYLSNWQRVINGEGVGIPNYFTWLDAYSPNPAAPGTVRQGFAQTTRSVNPYVASTTWDSYIVRNIYDSLTVTNPLNGAQQIDWMGNLNSNPIPPTQLTYVPPPGTVSTFRFTLRPDLFFQDGRKVTAFDAAFSYLSLKATGAFAGTGAAPMTGITVLGANQFDIGVNAVGPFTLQSLFGLPILPGAYWTASGSSAWNGGINACTSTGASCYPAQYTLTTPSGPIACALSCANFPAVLMTVNPADTIPTFDPIQNRVLIGLGPWKCGIVTTAGSGSCSSSGTENPAIGGSYTLTRFGMGLSPASSVSNIYFRSNGNLALWTWSQDDGDITHDFLTFSTVASCFGQLNLLNCLHWEMGIGGCGGTIDSHCQIGLGQIAVVSRFVGFNWVAPFNWQTAPPTGMAGFAPVLYEDGSTLNPASVAGCLVAFPIGGYDC